MSGQDVPMSASNNYQARLRQVNRLIRDLEAERDTLMGLGSSSWLVEHTLPGEKVTRKNVNSLIVLARVRDLLRESENGAKTAEVARHLEQSGIELKPATLRSHLSRFAQQKRIYHDKERRIWLYKMPK